MLRFPPGSVATDRISVRSGLIDSPAHKKCDRTDRAVALGFAWATDRPGTAGRSGLAYDGCDELDATAGGLWPRSPRYCSSQPSRMVTAVSGRYSNTVTYTYDSAGRKRTESLTIASQTYTSTTDYDAAGRISKLTYPDASEVIRTYTERGQLATLAVGSTTIDTRTYDDGGRMTASSYNNGVSESRAYNNDNTLASISFTGAAIGDLTYGWDANKNKTSETIGGVMSGYGFSVGSGGYDDEDRLVNWERSDTNLDQSWNLSLVGNWTSFTENSNVQNRTHGPTHELLTVASQSVTHDAKGNMTLIPAVLRPGSDPLKMKWDFENKLRAADTDNDDIDDIFYRFDALGRRVSRDDGTAHTIYFQDGQQTIADYPAGTAAGSPTYTYVYASYIDEPVMRGGSGGLRYMHRNQQYSITALTDGGGTIIERYAYTAYGQVTILDTSLSQLATSAAGNRYTYTGREWDEGLELYHYRARMYDAVGGRFVSRDPIGFDGSKWNLYGYVDQKPTRFSDPLGLHVQDPAGRWCCEGDTCTLSIGVRAPCRSVRSQILDNVLKGLPPMKGVVTGHAWIAGNCGRRWIRTGLYTQGPNPLDGPIIPKDEREPFRRFGATHYESMSVCSGTWDCVWNSMQAFIGTIGQPNGPRYCAIDPIIGGTAVNCSTWVRDTFSGCGIPMGGLLMEPFDFANRPGAKPGNKPCLNDSAGR